jgi:hypothetical protein
MAREFGVREGFFPQESLWLDSGLFGLRFRYQLLNDFALSLSIIRAFQAIVDQRQ